MIEHLSAEQISQWMVGERTPQLEQHVTGCAACRGELAQLESTLSQFRSAMRDTSSTVGAPAWREPAPSSWFTWPRMALTAAALVILVVAPLSWRAHVEQQNVREQAVQVALSDSQLLESVDSEISQAVPEPMEPLVTLATWNSTAAQKQKLQRQ